MGSCFYNDGKDIAGWQKFRGAHPSALAPIIFAGRILVVAVDSHSMDRQPYFS
jgi:hypothetical protein